MAIGRHRLLQLVADGVLIAAAWYLAFRLRFDPFDVPVYYDDYLAWSTIALVVALKLGVFTVTGIHHRWWRYVSTRDMWGIVRGVTAARNCSGVSLNSAASVVGITTGVAPVSFTRSE